MSKTAIIEIENLSKTFKNATEPAVNAVSFSINHNEIFLAEDIKAVRLVKKLIDANLLK